jgi:putative flippase GtrA
MWTKNALEKIKLESVISKGFLFQIEMKNKAYLAGCSIEEIPIIFPDRVCGKSKMSKKIFIEAMIKIWDLRKGSGTFKQFIKFALVGILGTITNLFFFFLFIDVLQFGGFDFQLGNPLLHWLQSSETQVSIFCFLLAASQNYFLNHWWSFTTTSKPAVGKWALFIIASLFGLAINLAVLNALLDNFVLPFKFIAQAAGIMAGMAVNFVASKFIVFRRKKENEEAP